MIWRFGNLISRIDWLAGRPAPASLLLEQFLTMDSWLASLNTSAPNATPNSELISDVCYLATDPDLTTLS